jgi:mono/diheme cytochrome c family protein
MHYLFRGLVSAMVWIFCCAVGEAQTPDYSNVGRTPTEQEIQDWDLSIGVDGAELPSGNGTAKEGALLYRNQCSSCHGQNLEGSQLGKALVGGEGTLVSNNSIETIGSYWAFTTALWDYINRAMPLYREETLAVNEVYALTAYVLYRNNIVQENDVMNAQSLPKVQMPNRNGFIPQRVEDLSDIQERGCKAGHCP